MIKRCKVCGCEFQASPSSKIFTCSKACSSILRSQSHIGKRNKWSLAGRAQAAAAAQKTENCKKGTPAARRKYYDDPEKYHSAKDWVVVSPDGDVFAVRNLSIFLRRRLGEDFGRKVYDGLRVVKLGMKRKVVRPSSQSHGWTLAQARHSLL